MDTGQTPVRHSASQPAFSLNGPERTNRKKADQTVVERAGLCIVLVKRYVFPLSYRLTNIGSGEMRG